MARTANTWDDAFAEARVFTKLALVAPALVVYFGEALVPNLDDDFDSLIRRLAVAAIVIAVAMTFLMYSGPSSSLPVARALHPRPIGLPSWPRHSNRNNGGSVPSLNRKWPITPDPSRKRMTGDVHTW